jgi:G6PDH family F420-dependent oxidoreductase
VENLVQAEATGFTFALISDHFHPWVSAQGHSPFVWAVLGGAATATRTIEIGTGVTCPIIRIHPAILAQAAATIAAMMEGRFFFGVGTGENLNEHILGDRWVPYDIRAEMFEEAIGLIRELWKGEVTSQWGDYYTVEDARLYTVPNTLPPIMVAASGKNSAQMAGRIGDGLINTSPDADIVKAFQQAGGGDKPRYGQLTVCWAPTQEEAVETAYKIWPNSGLKGDLNTELRTVRHFEQVTAMVSKEDIAESVICGPDPEPYIKHLQEFVDAGYDHLYIHQVGSDQAGFFKFFERELRDHLPATLR